MSDLRKKVAKAISVSAALGCGCCATDTATEEQQKAAVEMNIDPSSVYLADEVLEVINNA